MSKALRNTIFTLLALTLAAVGVNLNKSIAGRYQPISSEQAVLASRSTAADDQPFPLSINFAAEAVKLGQSQEIQFKTVPDAQLEIVTVYPDGTTNHPQTLKTTADSRGIFTLRFKLDDFHHLGLFQVSAVAVSGNKTASATAHFVLQTWGGDTAPTTEYQYPLVP